MIEKVGEKLNRRYNENTQKCKGAT